MGKKSGEEVSCLEVAGVILVQYNLVENQCQQNLKYYALLLQINIMFIYWMLNQVI